MELKSDWVGDTYRRICSFNRTFMELKSNCEVAYDVAAESFNRTFMELKFQCAGSPDCSRYEF